MAPCTGSRVFPKLACDAETMTACMTGAGTSLPLCASLQEHRLRRLGICEAYADLRFRGGPVANTPNTAPHCIGAATGLSSSIGTPLGNVPSKQSSRRPQKPRAPADIQHRPKPPHDLRLQLCVKDLLQKGLVTVWARDWLQGDLHFGSPSGIVGPRHNLPERDAVERQLRQ